MIRRGRDFGASILAPLPGRLGTAQYNGLPRFLMASAKRSRVSKLAPCRLKRAIDYVEARLDERVSLADTAAATAFTRMHFAAGLSGATGLPHEYLSCAGGSSGLKKCSSETMVSLVDAALSVEFQTQAHFPNRVQTLLGPTALNAASPLPFRLDRLQHDAQLAAPTAG